MNNQNGFNKCQINFSIRRDAEGHMMENTVLINLRTDSAQECYELFQFLRAKLNGDLSADKSKGKKEPAFTFNFLPENKKFCEECGSELVLRKAQKGSKAGSSFYGCSRFPLCSYTEAFAEAK